MDRARVGERDREIRTNTLTRTRIHASRLSAPFGEAQGNQGWHMSFFSSLAGRLSS